MQDLLRDPQAIRFTDGTTINLKLLKNEIDRRILKITALVGQIDLTTSKSTERALCDYNCHPNNQPSSLQGSHCSNRVLSSLNGNDMLMHANRAGQRKYGGKSGISSYLMLGESEVKMVSSKETELTKQDGKTQNFYKQEKGKLEDSHHSDDQSQLNLDLSNIQFDENISYEDQANQLKQYIRNTLSNRKKTATDRPKAQQQSTYPSKTQRIMKKPIVETVQTKAKDVARIVVSLSCMEKMQSALQQLIGQRRQYQMDYKGRANLLKKVQEKYKNDLI